MGFLQSQITGPFHLSLVFPEGPIIAVLNRWLLVFPNMSSFYMCSRISFQLFKRLIDLVHWFSFLIRIQISWSSDLVWSHTIYWPHRLPQSYKWTSFICAKNLWSILHFPSVGSARPSVWVNTHCCTGKKGIIFTLNAIKLLGPLIKGLGNFDGADFLLHNAILWVGDSKLILSASLGSDNSLEYISMEPQ